ncbi:phospholipase D family protein [Ornithinimicrobium sp. F0845]|uniref:phospholipase D family protein n=1 Tax=Ornithinimicrobium sp. F0845 TaxID=2926412 RepID=UPI001FF4BE78|nr:phospholipase D family protein [Ornithinimicrobium sp. F0845]MCK0114013.1 phospholipase D family protein [Ornithinimicrobium sp. F0845]
MTSTEDWSWSMLEPSTRALFVDAFRPPTGHHVDLAIGTTYTLGLRMLFLPPLAMAAHDREVQLLEDDPDEGHAPVDTLALLESVRRYADRTTVYCHAGAIGSPGSYPRLLTFAEDCVVQVLPPVPGHIFHPKVWALRFRRDDELVHRLVVCSRNLTDDSSWDTLLILDEGSHGAGIAGSPAADFVRTLPGMAVGHIAPDRPAQAMDLADSLRNVWFELPKPFTGGELHPLGLIRDGASAWPLPERPDRAVVISPFLDVPTATRIKARRSPVLVSREETYDLIGANAVRHTDVKVLNPHAEAELATDTSSPRSQPEEVRTGLHAKVLVWDVGSTGHTYTGSANATHAAFNGNVEFGVLLTGPRRVCGVEALLPDGEPSRDRITFGHIIQDHEVPNPEAVEDPKLKAERDAALHHEALLKAGPQLTCEDDDNRYAVSLTFARPLPTSPGTTRVRLVSRPRTDRLSPEHGLWRGVHLTQLTAYLEVVTQVPVHGRDDDLEIASVLKAELVGAPEDRASEVLRSYLGSEESIVRYLRFLLDDADVGSLWDDLRLSEADGTTHTRPPVTFEDLSILEPLLRAAADGSEALDRVEALLRDLGINQDEPGVVSAEFLALWQAVWEATGGERR